jgi:hypothetical protein
MITHVSVAVMYVSTRMRLLISCEQTRVRQEDR